MSTQERDIVDLLWNNDQADALSKLKDMLSVKAAMAVDASKQDIAQAMFPHVPEDGEPEVETPEASAEDEVETEQEPEETTDETDHGRD
tara:strand:+ start:164 stop:430 length:267 start_codon:yes stop_codon:yes gene_type:complete